MLLKSKVNSLYQQLGNTEDQSELETLYAAKEYDHIEPVVTRIVTRGANMIEGHEESAANKQIKSVDEKQKK